MTGSPGQNPRVAVDTNVLFSTLLSIGLVTPFWCYDDIVPTFAVADKASRPVFVTCELAARSWFDLMPWSGVAAAASDRRALPMSSLESFLADLRASPATANVFRPWSDYAPGVDASPAAPDIRLSNLRRYLLARLDTAEYVLIAEAPGYQGTRFSGIAMTCERTLLGGKRRVPTDSVVDGPKRRTSDPSVARSGAARRQGFWKPSSANLRIRTPAILPRKALPKSPSSLTEEGLFFADEAPPGRVRGPTPPAAAAAPAHPSARPARCPAQPGCRARRPRRCRTAARRCRPG